MRKKGVLPLLLIILLSVITSFVEVTALESGKIIAIDAGHGGTDPGAVGPTGLKEKDVNLEIAKRLRDYVSGEGWTPVMTRTDDSYVSLEDRVKIANDAGADIFISIHCNAAVDPTAQGTETYRYYGSTEGLNLATAVQSEVVSALGTTDRGVKEAGFYVLKYTTMPAILVEVAFITNPAEENLLRKSLTWSSVANTIQQGSEAYFCVPPCIPEFSAPWIVLLSIATVIFVILKGRFKIFDSPPR